MNNIRAAEEIIHSELEPSVISQEMIEDAIINSGQKGEIHRLQLLEPIDFEKVDSLRLEFKNILRIDHLWFLTNLTKLSLNFNKIEKIENIEMLTSLKDLDLSFNYIEKIQNLDKLVKLEVLSLFSNRIKTVENLDSLENLTILSIGQNEIPTINGIERFRFFSQLEVLNMEENPVSKDKENFRLFIAALLPNLIYYEYSSITEEERIKGAELWQRELREIKNKEHEEIELRKKIKKELEDEKRLSSSFVEHLNENQLFDSLFDEENKEGRAIQIIGEEAANAIREYRKDFYKVTQEIYKFGIRCYEERENELLMFNKSIQIGKKKAQRSGQRIIEDFLGFKENMFETIKRIILEVDATPESDILVENDQYQHIPQLRNEYFNRLSKILEILMEEETHLFESIEEAIGDFGRQMLELVNIFLEQVQIQFVSLREIAMNFSENIFDVTSDYVSHMLASGASAEVPAELQECLEDKEAIISLIEGIRDFHMQRIDAREDKLVFNAKTWVNNLLENMRKDDIERNRAKISEVNYFLEQMKHELKEYEEEVAEQIVK